MLLDLPFVGVMVGVVGCILRRELLCKLRRRLLFLARGVTSDEDICNDQAVGFFFNENETQLSRACPYGERRTIKFEFQKNLKLNRCNFYFKSEGKCPTNTFSA